MSSQRLILEWVILFACACLLALFSLSSGLTNRFDGRVLDYATWMLNDGPGDDIVIAAIDDRSLDQIGAWPWDRGTHGQLVSAIDQAGAKQILFDVLFLEPTQTEADDALASALKVTGSVVLPHTFGAAVNAESGAVPLFPIPEFAANAAAIGHVGAQPDQDGVLRRFEMVLGEGDRTFPQFTLAAERARSGGSNPVLNSEKAAIVPFSPPGTYPTISASDLVQNNVPADFLNGKTVIIGATAQGLGDRYSVSSGSVSLMAGSETQANLLSALRQGKLVYDAPGYLAVVITLAALLFQFVAFWRLKPAHGLWVTIGLVLAVGLAGIGLVLTAGLWVPVGSALLVLVLAYPLWSWRRLTAVSNYLEKEASTLPPRIADGPTGDGFDVVAQQVNRMRGLVRHVSDSFAFLQSVIEVAPDAIIVLDKNGAVQMLNPKAQSLFPDLDVSLEPNFQEARLVAGVTLDEAAEEMTTESGDTYLVARAQLDKQNAAEGGEIVALRDISQIRRREAERSEMLEFLSHDMRTPQVAIIGLSNRENAELKDDQRFGRIRMQAERTLKLADDFVQLARLEEATLHFEETDVVALAEEACDRSYFLAQKRKIELKQEMPEFPVFARIEASLVARLLDNLIGNAVKYSPANSAITLSVEERPDNHFRLAVTDEGPGLPPERLADPFARFGAHETKAGPSAGLGLTFVQRTVQKHGGTIKVHSGNGHGTSFVIDLPAGDITPLT